MRIIVVKVKWPAVSVATGLLTYTIIMYVYSELPLIWTPHSSIQATLKSPIHWNMYSGLTLIRPPLGPPD